MTRLPKLFPVDTFVASDFGVLVGDEASTFEGTDDLVGLAFMSVTSAGDYPTVSPKH